MANILDTLGAGAIVLTLIAAFLLTWRATIPLPTKFDRASAARRCATAGMVDAMMALVIGVPSLLLSLPFFSVTSLLIGSFFTAAGILAISGRKKLMRNDPEAFRYLLIGQVLILVTLLTYGFGSLASTANVESIDEINRQLDGLDIDVSEIAALIAAGTGLLYKSVILGTVLSNGGMLVYYWRRRSILPLALPDIFRIFPMMCYTSGDKDTNHLIQCPPTLSNSLPLKPRKP